MERPDSSQIPDSQSNSNLVTLADLYKYWYKTLFNKLSKEAQGEFLTNSVKPNRIVRGESWPWPNVVGFIRSVAEMAEEEFDKAQVKAEKALTSQ